MLTPRWARCAASSARSSGSTANPSPSSATVDAALAEYRAAFPEPRWQHYLDTHHARYRVLVGLAVRLGSEGPAPLRVLDIGPRFEVDLLRRTLPGAGIDTLGIDAGLFPRRDSERHVQFDLNQAWDPERRPTLGPYRLIVMAEVLEHLHTAPSEVLPWIGSLLEPGAHLLLQTPNAVALPKRLRMVAGIHPFQPLSTDRAYPGHYREYTIGELHREGGAAGLETVELVAGNYFDSPKRSNRLYQRLERVVPSSLRSGITVVFRRPRAG